MKKYLTIVACLVNLLAYGQQFHASEFLSLNGKSPDMVEKIMKPKGYARREISKELIEFDYVKMEKGSPVIRLLEMSKWSPGDPWGIQYSTWQEKESAEFIRELGVAGFKRVDSTVTDPDGTRTSYITFRKGGEIISYIEERHRYRGILFKFYLSNKKKRPAIDSRPPEM